MFLKESFHFAYNSNYRRDLLVRLPRPHLPENLGQWLLPLPPQGCRGVPGEWVRALFCCATWAFFLISKCFFAFVFPAKERNRNHSFPWLDSRHKPVQDDEIAAILPRVLLAAQTRHGSISGDGTWGHSHLLALRSHRPQVCQNHTVLSESSKIELHWT